MQTYSILNFFFQCRNILSFLGVKASNSELLLFDFIHQMLLELLLNVRTVLGAGEEDTSRSLPSWRLHLQMGRPPKYTDGCRAGAVRAELCLKQRFPALPTAATSTRSNSPGGGRGRRHPCSLKPSQRSAAPGLRTGEHLS